MKGAVVLGRGAKPPRDAGWPVLRIDGVAGAAGGFDRLLVVGTTAEVARVAHDAPGVPVAFAGAPELSRLFALDPSLPSAERRLVAGTAYPADLGEVECTGSRAPFLAAVSAGAGSAGGWRFPWAGRAGAVEIRTTRGSTAAHARAVVAANAQHWMRWTLAPRAAINDSRLEVEAFGGGLLSLWSLRRSLTLGLHHRHPAVTRVVADAAEVVVPPTWPVCADGVRVGRGAFRVLLRTDAVTLLI